jgi:hypothetical protein
MGVKMKEDEPESDTENEIDWVRGVPELFLRYLLTINEHSKHDLHWFERHFHY